jgi:hypothetical protein
MAVQKWLELALNLACSGINILLILVAVLNRRSASAGILAVAMTQAAQLNTNLMYLVVEWTSEYTSTFLCTGHHVIVRPRRLRRLQHHSCAFANAAFEPSEVFCG